MAVKWSYNNASTFLPVVNIGIRAKRVKSKTANPIPRYWQSCVYSLRPPLHFRCRFCFLNLHTNSILNNGKKEVIEEEKSSSTVGLFELFCLCFIISCVLSKCTEATNIIHSDSWQNVFSSRSWSPEKRRLVHCWSKAVQIVFFISMLVSFLKLINNS